MNFIEDVKDERERNSPVRAAVKANAADIQAARVEGYPLNAIYRTLRRKGYPVGAGYSSFRSAVRYLDQHGWPNSGVPAASVATSSAPPSVVANDGLAQSSRDRFVDDRNPSDF
ncbi:hypothetical protein L288_00460 [Sphingobium quisquiliarum P25]|uniref:Uncharacterized protein n=1 Tax=Sphingobium quisquiliarum P25 TaxID=1329909 RepID=T0IT54_9SPHN|nr:hypothetical protein [Sphingobium quisquiliarum]EQB15035.1 hypothetical protein L288_00460 [Sphingobium quisquiliarum P25]